MKKIIISILCALSIVFVGAQTPKESAVLEKLNLKHRESVIDEKGRKVDRETGVLRINRNEYFISETATEASEIALHYLQEKRDVYGLSGNPGDIKVNRVVESPSGKYVYFLQYENDIPVFATNFTVYIDNENTVRYALNEFRNVTEYKPVKNKSSVKEGEALKIANEYLNVKGDIIRAPEMELVYFESMDNGLELAWKINVASVNPRAAWQIFVSAGSGRIIHARDIAMPAIGSGKVFIPNPLVSANVPYGYNNCYLHNYGAGNPCLDSQLMQVTLNDLTVENGVYKLKGPYCVIENLVFPYSHIPELSTPNFHYTRDQEEFLSVMCYYHIDLSARRILQLGYNIPDGLKNLKADPHDSDVGRNAVYFPPPDNCLAFGVYYGNKYVPAAEDADIIWHEHGHAIQYHLGSGYMSSQGETKSLREGSSDYWATSYKRSLYPNNWAAFKLWFDMDNLLDRRRTDLNWVYPADYVPDEEHMNGQIWSSALMKIWGDLGRNTTDLLFLETHLLWGQSPGMRDGATAFMQADLNLYNGTHLCQIYSRFKEHGLIDLGSLCSVVNLPSCITTDITTTNFVNQTVTTDKTVFSCSDLNVQNVKVQSNAKLTLDATGTITITSDFEVELGSELEIK